MKYTTKTLRKEYSGRDVYLKFTDDLEKFQNVFMSTWNAVLADGISGKTWSEIWSRFTVKLVNSTEPVNEENLSVLEFKQPWCCVRSSLGRQVKNCSRDRSVTSCFVKSVYRVPETLGLTSVKFRNCPGRTNVKREDCVIRTKTVLHHTVQDKGCKSEGHKSGMMIANNCL